MARGRGLVDPLTANVGVGQARQSSYRGVERPPRVFQPLEHGPAFHDAAVPVEGDRQHGQVDDAIGCGIKSGRLHVEDDRLAGGPLCRRAAEGGGDGRKRVENAVVRMRPPAGWRPVQARSASSRCRGSWLCASIGEAAGGPPRSQNGVKLVARARRPLGGGWPAAERPRSAPTPRVLRQRRWLCGTSECASDPDRACAAQVRSVPIQCTCGQMYSSAEGIISKGVDRPIGDDAIGSQHQLAPGQDRPRPGVDVAIAGQPPDRMERAGSRAADRCAQPRRPPPRGLARRGRRSGPEWAERARKRRDGVPWR